MPDKSPPDSAAKPHETGAPSAPEVSPIARVAHLVQRTRSPRVLGDTGSLFRLDFNENENLFARNYREPVLVASGASVGAKVSFAAELNRYEALGTDLVAANVNNLILHGAEPLFFLHSISSKSLQPDQVVELIRGISDACVEAGCSMLGGNASAKACTRQSGSLNLAGFAVGVVERRRVLDGSDVEAGDSIIGLASSGLHTSGFERVRQVVDKSGADLGAFFPELQCTLAEELLRPTRIYVKSVRKLLSRYKVKRVIKAMAPVASGGIGAALQGMLRAGGFAARIKRDAWMPPPVFTWLQKQGGLDLNDMYGEFNMGIGFVLIVRPTFTKPITTALRTLGEKPMFLGKIRKLAGGEALRMDWS